uniref:Uncharacterized protein n=1 Tax=Arundo donax TaxID=35708 RepID=A0A0A9DY36_ARUDO
MLEKYAYVASATRSYEPPQECSYGGTSPSQS